MLLGSDQIVNVHSTVMDDDSCVLKYIEIVPLENNADQFEDLKPFQVKVCVITNLSFYLKIMKYKVETYCSCWEALLNASVSE